MKILLLTLWISFANCWSTFNPDDKAYFGHYEGSANIIADCQDELDKSDCEMLEKHCNGIRGEKIQKICKRTCGRCRAVSPPSCRLSKYGCCWDNVSISGYNGRDCPPCEDHLQDCSSKQMYCHVPEVRRVCSVTCGVPGCAGQSKIPVGGCFDDPSQANFCPTFKKGGFCVSDPNLMKSYCEKTCGLCDIDMESPGKSANPARDLSKMTSVFDQLLEKKNSVINKDAKSTKNVVAQDASKNTAAEQDTSKDLTDKKAKLMDAAILEALNKRIAELSLIDKLKKRRKTSERKDMSLNILNELMNDKITAKKEEERKAKAFDDESGYSREKRIEDLESKLLEMLMKKRSKKSTN